LFSHFLIQIYSKMNHPNPTKLALEEPKSWELYLDRREVLDQGVNENGGRRLKENHDEHHDEHDHHEYYRHHHRRRDKDQDGGVPEPDGDTMHGLMIDAGSQGTRIHIYEFERRLLHTRTDLTEALNGYKISFSTTSTRWTHRHKPGLDTLASYQDDEAMQAALIAYLGPVVEFSKSALEGKKQDWYRYPIHLKATGGLRTLPTPDRIRLMEVVRTLFQNKTFNPFNFDDTERARVISGKEEAIYGWAAVNFAMGTLVKDSEGDGTALNPKRTFGMLEMGGVSTKIAFLENSGDVMANLIKLQIWWGSSLECLCTFLSLFWSQRSLGEVKCPTLRQWTRHYDQSLFAGKLLDHLQVLDPSSRKQHPTLFAAE
jgi:hypothetical protein